MMPKRKPLLIVTLALVLMLSGFGWYAAQCLVRMVSDTPLDHFVAQAADVKYTCGMHPMVITDEPGNCPICGMELTPLKTGTGAGSDQPAGERKIKYWQAPMDPTYIRDEPGKSPMGMDLIPVYEDESPGGSMISIDPVTSQNMGIRTAPVTRGSLSRTVRTVGLVGYQEPKQYAVNTKINGWIEKLFVNEMGQQVKPGQKLLDIYSPELVSAQEEFLLALKHSETLADSPFPKIAEGGRQLLEASRRRLALWDISERQLQRLEQTRKVEKTLSLYAAHGGIVTMKMVQEGQFIKSGMDLMTISDISKVWVLADIYEYELPWVKVGQQAEILLPFVGSKSVTGTLGYLYPYVEAKTRTVKARFELDNPGYELKPDMYVNVHLHTSPVENALMVPAEAVLHSGEKKTVFVLRGAGKFEPREVKTGVQDDRGNLQIVQGLLEGDRVVTSAQFMLDSESKLREAIAKMLEPQAAPAAAGPASGGDAKLDDLFGDEPAKPKEKLDDLFN
jgi:Cu(I)/Ag(I) efflux system membrane fusion protein/cobalt-zinc-cadmium efflux system membrane fusion protein